MVLTRGMADTVPASGTMDIALKAASSVVDMHTNVLLHQPPKNYRSNNHNNNSDDNSHDEQEISASCADLTAAAVPLTTSSSFKNGSSPTNLSSITFRCERCDNFETSSRATLLLHVVQCLSSPARLKTEEIDAENLSLSAASGVVVPPPPPLPPHVNDHSNGGGSGGGVVVGGVGVNTSINSNNNAKEITNTAMSGSGTSPSNGSSSRKVFECDVCNMKFSNGANMRRHKMRHTGVKPYECRVCQKRFFRKDHLAEHFTTHTKTLPYHCPICNRGFQRQIAMRAHFQNEHVGQHDLVKTCPLCSYRAGSMKSLRIHFHNRHGIDLDNPGPGGSSSLLLALESQASQAAAAAAASYVPNLNAAAVAVGAVTPTTSISAPPPNHQSDSGDSLRSTENATPPMHFLTPHVEISMPDNSSGDMCNGNSPSAAAAAAAAAVAAATGSGSGSIAADSMESRVKDGNCSVTSPPSTSHITSLCSSPGNLQDEPMDCNTKSIATNSINGLRITSSSPKSSSSSNHYDNHIMPSISLIPIKQEPLVDDSCGEQNNNSNNNNNNNCQNTLDALGDKFKADSDSDLATAESRKLSSLIKVSPLKSLLREDLKRRICAKANNRIIRNAAVLENNNIVQNTTTPAAPNSVTAACNATAICNGTITSSGQETESAMLSRKQMLTCLFCGIEFPDETLYFLHKGCHCESNPWKCNICGEQCNNVYEFNSHLLSKSHQ